MPVKTHKSSHKRYPKHYAKVYWPYLPLIIVMGIGLFLGNSFVNKSQRGVLAYATNVSSQALLEETNAQRVADGQKPLTLNQQLMDAAAAKAKDMVARDYWSHNTPDGKAPWIFIDQTGYGYQKAGENLAYGFGTSKETITGWMNSPAHRENILDPTYREVGFGIVNDTDYQGTGPETIVVALYANPLHDVQPVTAPKASTSGSFTTLNSNAARTEPQVKSISKIQTLTQGKAPWITFVVGLIGGVAFAYLLIKHGLGIRRRIKDGEKFVLKHPAIDATIVLIILVCYLLIQSVGFIR